MPDNGKIEPAQFRKLVMFFILGRAILITPTFLAEQAKQDAWISAAAGLLFGVLIVLLLRKMGTRFPESTLPQYSQGILGRWAGSAVAFLFFLHALLLCSLTTRSLSVFMASTMMPETPIQWIIGLYLFIAAVGARKGIENIGKTADVFYPLVVALFIIFVVFVTPQIEAEKLQPVLAKGMAPVLSGAYQVAGFPYMNLVLLLPIFPFVSDSRQAAKSFLQGTLLGGGSLCILTLLCVAVLGGPETANELFPTYEMAKTIEIGMFVQRVEAIMALMWFITIYFQVVICFYVAITILAQIFRLTDYRPLVFPMAFLLTAFAQLIAPSISYLIDFSRSTWSSYTLTYGLLILVLLALAAVRRGSGRRSGEASPS
ncbi:GerAB/ArcD/ProY family transporter [Cohnella sp. CFH 77786]|uniref:GerAB/ArcD/ProY family transporter n=1 Tax=Cohnella sp. CFH 77786 TaxID=2662265 RepID=UPI001C60F390|nr:endospore germination permease [Cohnella sp. CFH 77786]MBW5447959.1 GerAB/ArcD/ProY family transporter [Cohnella sp. CFH 77786]